MLKVAVFNEFMAQYGGHLWQDLTLEEERVRQILAQVRCRGDAALKDLTLELDGVLLDSLEVAPENMAAALREVEEDFLSALRESRERITAFHRHQGSKDWSYTGPLGEVLGQKITPLEKVGIYIPGGSAVYPSSILMTAVPAQVAGVREIYICTPPGPQGKVNPYVLAAAAEVGVTRVFPVGGAQAVAAMTFGTATIPAVEKICGPGNLYVTLAKKLVYGQVGIDMLAGPSEVLIIADETAPAAFVAADILAQGEHGPTSACYLVCFCREQLTAIFVEIEKQLPGMPRREIAAQALEKGQAILVANLEEAFAVANRIAPEHLQVFLKDPWGSLARIKNAGAICLGAYTPAAVGDYWAGPSHVLPTGGAARFSSPLGVDDFLKKSSIIYFQADSLARASKNTAQLATVEGFTAHANALRIREGKRDES